jgi:hypothetical protein
MNAEPVRERRVDVERLLRLLDLLLLAEILDRPHVVQPVRELDEDHPDVLGHRDDHLAVVLRLRLLAALELNPGQLRDAFDEPRDLLTELGTHVVDVGLGVLDHVVEQRSGERLLVEMELGADARNAYRVLDEIRAGAPLLPFVRRCREPKRARDELAIDRSAVLCNRGQELIEEPLVLLSTLDNCHLQSVLRASRKASCPEGTAACWSN